MKVTTTYEKKNAMTLFKSLNNKTQARTFSHSLKKSSCNFQTLFSTWIMEECTENFTTILKKKV